MAGTPITHFEPDAERLAVIRECMEHYEVGDPEAEWPNNIISRRAVVYGSGMITRQGVPVRYAVDPEELALCRRLSDEAEELMAGVEVGMGSESGDPFRAFFVAGTVGDPPPAGIDEALIRSRFGGTIFPPATITVEPLAEAGVWWAEIQEYGAESEQDYLAPWRALIAWFRGRSELLATAFVRVGDREALWEVPREAWPEGTEITGCVLPRLALGLTHGGSLVGLFGYSVQT
jgi:hypothetical protein